MTFAISEKPTSSFSKTVKPISSFTKTAKPYDLAFLLLQTGGYFLLQTGGRLILNLDLTSNWTKTAKP